MGFKISVALIILAAFNLHSVEETVAESCTKKILVVGCGRSGTTYIARFFQLSGLDVIHERSTGSDGSASWFALGGTYFPSDPITEGTEFEHVFHQVRHPLNVITSWLINVTNLKGWEWEFVRKHVPEISQYDSLLVQCAKYWYYWNLKAEKIAEWRYRIEDLPFVLSEFEMRLKFPFDATVFDMLPCNINTWASTSNKITWAELQRKLPKVLFKQLRGMAYRYGYSIVD